MALLSSALLTERLVEAKETRILSLGYLNIEGLPTDFTEKLQEHRLQNAGELDLSSNKLSELPDLSPLKFLHTIQLKYNLFSRLPPALLGLPRLEVLELAGNQLTSLDERILGALPRLRELDVSSNQLAVLPDSIVRMPALQQLVVDHNALEYLPDNIGSCTSLVRLVANTNQLTALPSSLALLPRLQRLDASANLLTTVPPALGGIKTLKEFNLRYNNQLDPLLMTKSEEGLSKLLGHLREVAEKERLAGIEALKPVGVQAGVFTEYRMKADAAQRMPGDAPSLDNRCWVRTGHSLSRVGQRLVLLGGLVLHTGQKTIDAYWVTDDRMEWHRHTFAAGERPTARDGHCCVVDGTRLILFGGRNQEGRRLNDVWSLDTEAFAWGRVPTMGAVPPARHSAASAFHNGKLIIFGGSGTNTRLNDVWSLDVGVDTPAWKQVATGGAGLGLRHSAGHCLHGDTLYVHGGFSNFVLGDLFALDLTTMQWRELGPFTKPGPKAQGHSLTIQGNYLWLFGGANEANVAQQRLFRLDISRISEPQRKLTWEEMQVNLPLDNITNVETTANLLLGGRLELCLSRPEVLHGTPRPDDANSQGVIWNVYRAAPLEAFDETAELAADLPAGTTAKSVHIAAYKNEDPAKVPAGSSSTSREEQAMLQHVDAFIQSRQTQAPDRLPLFIAPCNERGVRKLACTSVRPVHSTHPLMAEMDGICSFVSDYILYEPLQPPIALPPALVSPSALLHWQSGDAFDMANFLCCLLLGAGYDAFVVVGHAPESIVKGATDTHPCPPLARMLCREQPDLGTAPPADSQDTQKELRYKARPRHVPAETETAKAMQRMTQDEESEGRSEPAPEEQAAPIRRRTSDVARELVAAEPPPAQATDPATADSDPAAAPPAAGAAGAESQAAGAPAAEEQPQPGGGEEAAATEAPPPPASPVHAWVLVLKGRREVARSLFVEPSTNDAFPVDAAPYINIEYLWNQYNFWVALPKPCDQEGMAQPKAFDLDDGVQWQRLLDHPACQHTPSSSTTEDASQMANRKKSRTGKATIRTAQSMGSRANSGSTSGFIKPLRDRNTAMTAFASHLGQPAAHHQPPVWHSQPDMPAAWTAPHPLTADMVDKRCPAGVRSRLYERCTRDSFAWAGLFARWDGQVERITRFEDDARLKTTDVQELFQRRADKLRERRSCPDEGTCHEFFDSGAAMSVSSLWTAKDGRYEVRFKSRWRHDGLIRRAEVGNGKIVEEFEGRADGLVYRSARYSARIRAYSEPSGVWASPIHVTNAANSLERPLFKLTERFVKSQSAGLVLDGTPAARRTFYLPQGDIELDLHRSPGHITSDRLVLTRKGALRSTKLVNPLSDPPHELKVKAMLQSLLEDEFQAIAAVRDGEKEVSSIIELRRQQECDIRLTWAYPDADRDVTARPAAGGETVQEGLAQDYLASFLPTRLADSPSAVMTANEASEAKNKCMQALSDRLNEREGLIKSRRASMVTGIAERQAKWEKERAHLTNEEAEAWEASRKDDTFKLAIIDKRLRHHEQVAAQQLRELKTRLTQDPRMSFLREVGVR